MASTPRLPASELPLYGTLDLPEGGEPEGPSDGLTLDAAIELLVRQNPQLRAQFVEIPMAQADVLTASLRANPIFYADSQLVPYGRYSPQRPGGQTQYDVNISYPLDVSHKRHARVEVAERAKRVLEAQFQDAVRLQIDNLYTVFTDVLAARDTALFARASVAGLDEVLTPLRERFEKELIPEAEVNIVKVQRDFASIGLADSEQLIRQAKLRLVTLLGLASEQADGLELLGTVQDTAAAPPPSDALVQVALQARPDLMAYRLAVHRTQADVRLALANRYADVYVLYQPYTFQDNTSQGLLSATSWALGVTVPLPIYNRNQGNIERAKLGVRQTQMELGALERQVISEVIQAEREYRVTRQAIVQVDREVLPAARQVRDTALLRYRSGDQDVLYYLDAQRSYNDTVRQYRDLLVRHRRSMLSLNTAVGRRILP